MKTTTRPSVVRRIFAFPLVWALIGAAVIAIGDGVLVGSGGDLGDTGLVVFTLIGAGFSIGVYVVVMKLLARRGIGELYRGLGRETLLGLAVGAVFMVASGGILVLTGAFTIKWMPVDAAHTILMAVVVTVGAAVVEELVFRGLLLQAIERLGGTAVAIVVTALLFGGAHFFNPDADLWSSASIAIEASTRPVDRSRYSAASVRGPSPRPRCSGSISAAVAGPGASSTRSTWPTGCRRGADQRFFALTGFRGRSATSRRMKGWILAS